MVSESVESALRGIASDKMVSESSLNEDDVAGQLKVVGGLTNNGLLHKIYSESKRSADEQARTNAMLQKMSTTLDNINFLMESQLEILSKMSLASPQSSTNEIKADKSNSSWYYRGIRLTSRHHIHACILSQLIDIVQLHLDSMGKYYPDSVDCDFKTLVTCVRIVCTERCSIRDLVKRESIGIKEKDTLAADLIYKYISSPSKGGVTSLSEQMLPNISNPITRPILQEVEWVRQRLCYTEGVLSAKQVDILRSIGFPLIKQSSQSELNWDRDSIFPRGSHTLTSSISSLKASQKDAYIRQRMKNHSMVDSYAYALEFDPKTSK